VYQSISGKVLGVIMVKYFGGGGGLYRYFMLHCDLLFLSLYVGTHGLGLKVHLTKVFFCYIQKHKY
jgi:hypothetical protein